MAQMQSRLVGSLEQRQPELFGSVIQRHVELNGLIVQGSSIILVVSISSTSGYGVGGYGAKSFEQISKLPSI
jgi:hypothetical protein